jgi:hypothetical protein
VVVLLDLVVHLPMLRAPNNLYSPPTAMAMALPVSFSSKERAHEQ